MHVEFMFFEWLTLYFRPFGGTVESSTLLRPVPGNHRSRLWSLNSSSWKLCKCTSNSRFRVINPLFLTPRGYGRIFIPSTTCPEESSTILWSFNSSSWKLCECTSNSRFRVINPLFLTPRGYGRIVNPSTTCPGESSTTLWSFNSSSWKLCEWTSNSRFSGY